jgi:hypothetical protein
MAQVKEPALHIPQSRRRCLVVMCGEVVATDDSSELQFWSENVSDIGFKTYDLGYIHIDVKYLPQMANETSRGYLFVSIDRASRWVFIAVYRNKTVANARRFLRDLERACPIHIRTILTDNEKEFADRLLACESALQRDSMSSTSFAQLLVLITG